MNAWLLGSNGTAATLPHADAMKVMLLVCCAIGGLGWIVQLALLNAGSPGGYYVPYASSVWLSSFVVVWSLQGFLFLRMPGPVTKLSLFGSMFITLVSFLLMLGFYIGYRPGAGTWGLLLLGVAAFNAWVRRYYAGTGTGMAGTGTGMGTGKAESLSCKVKALRCSYCFLIGLTVFLNVMLLGGCYLQADGYRRFSPDGEFVTITHPDGGVNRILTKCLGPAAKDTPYPTIWVEVGGGGHSSSDLYGIRDLLSAAPYNRRFCIYDFPGTGWSDERLVKQPTSVMEPLMKALGEEGPFVCIGSMDRGHDRCYQYALDHPSNVKAVVSVSGVGPFTEFGARPIFDGTQAKDDGTAACRSANAARKSLANIYNFFVVGWGLIAVFVPTGEYQPSQRAYEKNFLNLMNEKQWSSQAGILDQSASAADCGEFMRPSLYVSKPNLDPSVAVVMFELTRNASQLDKQCKDWGFALDSKDCEFQRWQYNETISFLQKVVNRNPTKNQLVMCNDPECGDNGFNLNQDNNIPWFGAALMNLVGNITK